MKRNQVRLTIIACVLVGLFSLRSTQIQSQEATKTDLTEATKPARLKVETGRIVIETTLKGTIESENSTEFSLEAKAWGGPFTVKSTASHGSRVKKGDVILELDTIKIDQAISDLRLERSLSDLSLRLAKEELPILEQFLPLNLAEADRSKQNSEEDFKRYTDIEREHAKKSSEFQLKSQIQSLDYANEELKQLQKMYRDKDLTEETEEIILKRQRNQIEQLQFYIESLQLQQDREAKLDLPRRDQAMKDHLVKQSLNWQKSQFALPLEIAQKRLALQKQEIERARMEERFGHLEADRAAMIFHASNDGIVYHGQSERGQWNTASVSNRLRKNGEIQSKEVVMTIVSPRPALLRADVEEKDLHELKEGLTGRATPVGFPSLKLEARLKSVSIVPRAAGNFEARIALEIPEKVETVLPGMTANVKFVTYRNDAAVLVPTPAIFHDDGSDVAYVFVAGEGAPVRTEIETGRVKGDKTEVLNGLKAGVEILATKP